MVQFQGEVSCSWCSGSGKMPNSYDYYLDDCAKCKGKPMKGYGRNSGVQGANHLSSTSTDELRAELARREAEEDGPAKAAYEEWLRLLAKPGHRCWVDAVSETHAGWRAIAKAARDWKPG